MNSDPCLAHTRQDAIKRKKAKGSVRDSPIIRDPHSHTLPGVDAAIGSVIKVAHGEKLVVCKTKN